MRKVLLTLALVGLLAVPVCAQFGFGFGRGMDATQLILQKSVQEELKLSDDQKKVLTEANDAFQKAFREAIQEKDFSGIAKANETRTEAVKKVIDKLDAKQAKRLMQIDVQLATKSNSPRIFTNPDVQKALKLTTKQKDLAKDTLAEVEKDVKEYAEENKGQFQKIGEKVAELNKEAFTKITKSFDDDQKKAWETLGGEKFTGEIVGPFGKGKDKGKKKKDDF
jgi:hypothetical protein